MLIDGLKLVEGSSFVNATISNGTAFPSEANSGELFFRSDSGLLHFYSGTEWIAIGSSSSQLNGQPGSYYLDLGNATGILSVEKGGTGVSTLAMLRTSLELDNYQPIDADLTAIAGIQTNVGLLRKTAANTWVLDAATYLTGNQNISVTGDVSGSGTTAIATTLANAGTPGTYRSVTTDAKGRVTAGTNPTTLAGYGITDALPKTGGTMTGDITMQGSIIPAANITYDLGSPTMMWKDIYVGPGSIYMNGTKILEEVASTIVFSTDENQNVRIETSGTGNLELQAATGGAIQVKGTLSLSSGKRIVDSAGIQVEFADNIEMGGNKITGLTYPTAGTDAANKAYVDGATTSDATLVRTTGDQSIAGQKTFTGNVIMSGNLTISGTTTTVNSQTVLLADNILELNSDFTTGMPSENSGIQIRRGDLGTVQFIWDEGNDRFTMVSGAGASLPLFTGSSVTAGMFYGPLAGNAETASRLAIARTINGASFDGGSNISFTTDAVAEGTTNLYHTIARAAAAAPVQSFNTRVGPIVLSIDDVTTALAFTPANKAGDTFTGNVTAPTFIGALTGRATSASTVTITTDDAFTSAEYVTLNRGNGLSSSQYNSSKLSFIPSSGQLTATTFVGAGTGLSGNAASLSIGGNAGTATALQTARTIAGVSFDGTANIVLTTTNIAEGTNLYHTAARASAAAPVQSFNLRTGAISLASSDVTGALGFSPVNKAGDTLTGKLTTGVPGSVTAVTSLNGVTAAIGIQQSVVASNGTPSYTPFLHNTTVLNGQGYIQHVSIGAYRPGTVAWGGSIYMAIGGSDTNATEAFHFNYGGSISHSSGTVMLNGNVTGSAGTMPFSGLTAKPTKISDHGITDFVTSNVGNALPTGGNGMTTNGVYYVQGMSILGQTDGALYGQAYDTANWQHQIYGDYRTGQTAVRGRNNGVWQAWRTVVDSSNITSYTAGSAQAVSVTTDENYAGIEYLTLNRGSGPNAVQYNTAKLSFVPSTGNLRAQNGFYTDLSTAYSKNLYVGNAPSSGTNQASVAVTNGNLHIDPAIGGFATYLSFYSGTGGTKFGNGASGIVADVNSAGVFTGTNFSGPGTGLTGTAASLSVGTVYVPDGDRNAATKLPTTSSNRVRYDFVGAGSTGTGGNYAGVMTFAPWTGDTVSTGGPSYQLAFGSTAANGGTPQLRLRNGIDSTWNGWNDIWHTGNLSAPSVTSVADKLVLRDGSGHTYANYGFVNYLNTVDHGVNGDAGTVTSIMTKRGDNYLRATSAASVKTYLGITGADVYSDRTNTASYVGVAREMAWKNYGNSHTIIDASAGTSPSGSAINNTNAANAWSATFPTLVGWNGSQTYGVRVDSARISDTTDGLTAAALGKTYTWTGSSNDFMSTLNSATAGPMGTLRATGNANQGAGMSFLRSGQYAINMGLDNDNVFRIGGWSAAANRLQMDMSGNLTMAGDIIAYSDARLKNDVQPIENGLNKINALRGVSYVRNDNEDLATGKRSIGVIAQEVREVLPELVLEAADGTLGVNYGNMVAVLIEAVKELTAKVATLEAKLNSKE